MKITTKSQFIFFFDTSLLELQYSLQIKTKANIYLIYVLLLVLRLAEKKI